MRIFKTTCVLFIILVLSACNSWLIRPVDQNYSYLYDFGEENKGLTCKIFHFSPDSSRLFIEADLSEWRESINKQSRPFKLWISGLVYNDYFDKRPVDSIFYSEKIQPPLNTYRCVIDLPVDSPKWQLISLELGTEKTSGFIRGIFEIDRAQLLGEQYYVLYNAANSQPITESFVQERPFKVKSLFGGIEEEYVLTKARSDSVIAAPPFAKDNNKAPLILKEGSSLFNGSESVQLPALNGMYFLRSALDPGNGIPIYAFSSSFPDISGRHELLNPLRYLSTKEEYEKLFVDSLTDKDVVEKFWLGLTGNRERANLLARAYYDRVEKANHFFTSLKPGWMTDRGMIYTVLGEPDLLFKNKNREAWVYTKVYPQSNVEFSFIRVDNEYANNSFVLQRSNHYEPIWYKVVGIWRQGRIPNPQ